MILTFEAPPNTTQIPPINDVANAISRLNYQEMQLWTPHYDKYPMGLKSEDHINGWAGRQAADNLTADLDCLQAAEVAYSVDDYLWLPKPADVIQHAASSAESIRRNLSNDFVGVSETLPSEDHFQPLRSLPNAKQHIQKARAKGRALLGGFYPSVANDYVRHAEASGNYSELVPLTSERTYQPTSITDVNALSQETDTVFAQLAADLLSPVRNERQQITEECLLGLASQISERNGDLGSLSDVLLLNSWALSQKNEYFQVANQIHEVIPSESGLYHYMSLYEPVPTVIPDQELTQRNTDRYIREYVEAGGDKSALEPNGERVSVRMRLTPSALWSLAMRDDGMIRSGDEGAAKAIGRGYDGNYTSGRKRVEKALFGEAAADVIKGEQIVYGYYASDDAEKSPALRSLARIYGSVELVFKPDIPVEKRLIYGDSMNAIALAAVEQRDNQLADDDFTKAVLNERIVPEADAELLARVINYLHGQEENTEFNVSADPYIECLMRGRLNLADCQQIRVTASVYDTNPTLMETIAKRYGVEVVPAA